MKTWLTTTALALSMSLAPAAIAQSNAASAADWRADTEAFLDVLLREHDNPFFVTPQADFMAEVEAYLDRLDTLSHAERVAGLARIAGLVGDGHTWMPLHALPFDGLPPGPGFRALPVRFELFDDGLYIVGTGVDHADLLGARIEAFGDVSAAVAVERALDLLPQDAVNFSAELAPEWLMQAELLVALDLADSADAITLSLSRPEGAEAVTLAPLTASARYDWVFSNDSGPTNLELDWQTAAQAVPLWREAFSAPIRVETLDGAAYLQINQIRDGAELSYADYAADAVARAEALDQPALILDLRRCLGGDGTLNAGLMAALTASDALAEPGRLAVLTSRQTHSAAVMLVSDLEQQTAARFYGQATADRPNHYGETNIFVTPNTQLPIIHASEYYQTSHAGDARRFVTPDTVIPYRFSDYQAGTDPVLAAALSDIKEIQQ